MANFWDWVNKQANKQPTTGDELLYADALKNQEARNAANNQYAAAAAAAKSGSANSSSLQGTIDPDRTGAAAPPRKGLYDQTGMNATAANAASTANAHTAAATLLRTGSVEGEFFLFSGILTSVYCVFGVSQHPERRIRAFRPTARGWQGSVS